MRIFFLYIFGHWCKQEIIIILLKYYTFMYYNYILTNVLSQKLTTFSCLLPSIQQGGFPWPLPLILRMLWMPFLSYLPKTPVTWVLTMWPLTTMLRMRWSTSQTSGTLPSWKPKWMDLSVKHLDTKLVKAHIKTL